MKKTLWLGLGLISPLLIVAVIALLTGPIGGREPPTDARAAVPTPAAPAPQPVAASVPATLPVATAEPATAPVPASWTPHTLTAVSWGSAYQEAMRAALFEPYRQASGRALADTSYTAGTLDELRQAVAGGGNWDVVDLELSHVRAGCTAGVLQPIDWSRIPDQADFIPAAKEPCGVGNVVWAYVLAYDPGTLPRNPVSWADFWDVAGLPGRRGLRNQAQWNLEIALLADGVQTRDVYTVLATPQGVDRAFAKLDQLKPHTQWWAAAAEPMQMIADDSAVMTTTYNGRVNDAQKNGIHVQTVWHHIIYTIDYWTLVNGSPNTDEAYDFIAFASRPQPLADLAGHLPYGPVNMKSMPLIDPAVAKELPTHPANLRNGMVSDADFWNRHGEVLEARFAQWMTL